MTNYPPHIRENQIKLFNAEPAKTTILADAESVGIDPNEVNTLVIRYGPILSPLYHSETLTTPHTSHAHWDHSFPVGSYFPNAKVLCGPGTLELTAESWPDSPDSHYDSRIWNPAKSELPIEELPDPKTASDKWRPIGPFPRGYDYFGDGSFWLIDAPGHVDGNLAALVRTQNRDRERRWIVLGGDCLHCYHLVHHPEAPFGKGLPINTSGTLHADVDEARNTIRKISSMKKAYGDQLFVWPAHDNLLEGLWEFDV